MKREIKFRAWCKTHSMMVEVGACFFETGSVKGIFGKGSEIFMAKPNVILVQFTGLKDRKEKEIYEGDIVQSYYDKVDKIPTKPTDFPMGKRGRPFAVEIEAFGDSVTIKGRIKNECSSLISYLVSLPTNCEVIGNIYENPELLDNK
jgi:uncharacterized phage protein (TIGR01671 family)